jgi:small-conductance mechanosensitive channel
MMKFFKTLTLLVVIFSVPAYCQSDSTQILQEQPDSLLLQQPDSLPAQHTDTALFKQEVEDLIRRIEVTDSMRRVTKGMPVVVENATLFYIYTNRGGLTAAARSKQISKAIIDLGKTYGIQPDSVRILADDYTTDIMYGDKVIISLTDKDAMWENMPRPKLAALDREKIVAAMKVVVAKHGFWRLVKNIAWVLLILIGIIIGIYLMNFGYRKLKLVVDARKQKYLKPIFIKNYQLLSIAREEKIVFLLLNILRYVAIALFIFLALGLIFGIFPQTEGIAMKIFSYVWNPLTKMGNKAVNFIPDLFTIVVIYFLFRYLIKGVGYLANEIKVGRLKINGFYPDWAQPTFAIISVILNALMVVMMWPYLPMSNQPAFAGMTVFLGLIMSFASGPALGNLIAGIIITYMRPFQIGDRIKINDIMGNVVEKTPIVTRLRTTKNEIVTIPNTTIMSSQSTNLSESAREQGLIVYMTVSFSYDTPWRTVHELLIAAANKTENVLHDPAPFVHEVSFDDFYTSYEINAYINDANKISGISSDLRCNIQDAFQAAGISMTSLHYQNLSGEIRQNAKQGIKTI